MNSNVWQELSSGSEHPAGQGYVVMRTKIPSEEGISNLNGNMEQGKQELLIISFFALAGSAFIPEFERTIIYLLVAFCFVPSRLILYPSLSWELMSADHRAGRG